jgi:hypothetical protein
MAGFPKTIRQQILEAVVNAINTGKPGYVPDAEQHRVTPLDLGRLPAIDVAPGVEEVQRVGGMNGPIVRRSMKFKVRLWVHGDAPEIKSDALAAWVTSQLVGNPLDGLVIAIEENGTNWIYEVADDIYGVAEIEFTADYTTKRNDLEAKA